MSVYVPVANIDPVTTPGSYFDGLVFWFYFVHTWRGYKYIISNLFFYHSKAFIRKWLFDATFIDVDSIYYLVIIAITYNKSTRIIQICSSKEDKNDTEKREQKLCARESREKLSSVNRIQIVIPLDRQIRLVWNDIDH